MKILIDAMGGDFAPLEQIKGCIEAKKEYNFEAILVGNREKIEICAQNNGLDLSGITIVHAENTIEMNDPPLSVRSKPDTSLRVGFEMLANGEADAFVSSGSTGAVQTGATLFVKRIKGVTRSVIASVLPFKNPTLLLDSGANATFTAEMLRQYALMGSIYMKKLYDIPEPRVGLLNIGSEEHKGTEEHAAAYQLLKEDPRICFIGNVEGNTAMNGCCDVIVADGFSGNIFLKTVEGTGKLLLGSLKEMLKDGLTATIGKLLLKERLYQLKKRFDAAEYGGAPLIGISKPVIKAHGNSDSKAIKNAVRQALKYASSNVIETIETEIQTKVHD